MKGNYRRPKTFELSAQHVQLVLVREPHAYAISTLAFILITKTYVKDDMQSDQLPSTYSAVQMF